MKTQRLFVALSALNLLLFIYQLSPWRQAWAKNEELPILRGSGLQIVDKQGQVRASIMLMAEDPKTLWKGKPYPETALLRMMSPDGRPNVKLGASKMGAALVIGGEANPTYVQILGDGGEAIVKLVDQKGHEKVIKAEP